MFVSGTKVIVTHSSVNKKIGPRVGSIGFVGQPQSHISQIGTIFINNNLKFIVYLSKIHFMRYGLEQTLRIENKNVYIAFPLISNPNEIKNTLEAISHKKLLNELYAASQDINTSRDIVICVPMFPNCTYSIAEASQQEKFCWILSIISGLRIDNFLAENKQRVPLLSANLDLLSRLYCAETDLDFRNKYIRELFGLADQEYVEKVINILQTILVLNRSFCRKRDIEQLLNAANVSMFQDSSYEMRTTIENICAYLFYPYFDDCINKLITNSFDSTGFGKEVLKIIKIVQSTKKLLVNH